jgi:phosphoribosylanthranilate isomerase
MARVKVCGINSAGAYAAAAEAGADWLGLVFYERSPRNVTAAQARDIVGGHAGGPPLVGLFVGAADADIAAVLDVVRLDILQIYDRPDRVAAVAARFGLPVWQAVGLGADAPLPHTAGAAAALVVESPPPPGATRPGGNAVALEWTRFSTWRPGFDWLLAGGLTPGNVALAIAQSGAAAVDVSSGVETAPGVKSSALIRDFVRAAKAAP